LLYDEVERLAARRSAFLGKIDDLLTTFERNGIEFTRSSGGQRGARGGTVVEQTDRDATPKTTTLKRAEAAADLDLTPGSMEKTNDPVRMYLREMGTVPL